VDPWLDDPLAPPGHQRVLVRSCVADCSSWRSFMTGRLPKRGLLTGCFRPHRPRADRKRDREAHGGGQPSTAAVP